MDSAAPIDTAAILLLYASAIVPPEKLNIDMEVDYLPCYLELNLAKGTTFEPQTVDDDRINGLIF